MKHISLIRSGLWRKPIRTVLTFLSIAAAFALFGSLHGIGTAFDAVADRVSPNRLRVVADQAGAFLPARFAGETEGMIGVSSVMTLTPLGCHYQDPKNMIFALALGGTQKLDVFADAQIPAAQVDALRATRNGAIVGRQLADRFGWRIGTTVPLTSNAPKRDGSTSWPFVVVGIYDVLRKSDPTELFLFNYDYLDANMVSDARTVAMLFVDTEHSIENDVIAAQIDRKFANSERPTLTQSERDFQRALINQAGEIRFLVNVTAAASLFVLLFVTTNTMWQSVRQRSSELAVLRAIGYSDAAVTGLIVCEAVILCTLAAILGLSIASTLFPFVAKTIQIPYAAMPARIPLTGLVIAVVLAITSSIPTVLRANRLSISSALARRT